MFRRRAYVLAFIGSLVPLMTHAQSPALPDTPVGAVAMNFVAGTRALIIDMRENGGGSPAMVSYASQRYLEPPHRRDHGILDAR